MLRRFTRTGTPDGKMTGVAVGYDVSDNCPGTTCALTVSASEGSASDWQVVDAHHVLLRATRAGDGPGRTYRIAVTCKDSGGAVSSQTAKVVVPHDQAP